MHTFDRSLKFSAAPDLTATQDCGAAFGGWGGSKLPECSNFQLGGSKRLQCSESRFGIQTGFQIELRNQSWKMLFGATLLLSTRSNFPASAVEASIRSGSENSPILGIIMAWHTACLQVLGYR